jgi:hypothetical protein
MDPGAFVVPFADNIFRRWFNSRRASDYFINYQSLTNISGSLPAASNSVEVN